MNAFNAATRKVISWTLFLLIALGFGYFSAREIEVSSDKVETFVAALAGGVLIAASVDALIAAYRATVKKYVDVRISVDGRDVHVVLPVNDKEKVRRLIRDISYGMSNDEGGR